MSARTVHGSHGIHQPRRHEGFTLIEVMITVAIIGLLTAIALPSYNQYIERTHRSNAKNTLQQTAQWMERAATATGQYPATEAIPPSVLIVEGGRYRTVTVVVSANGTNYTATAAALGAQANDACGNFTLTQAGARGVSGTLPVKECWER